VAETRSPKPVASPVTPRGVRAYLLVPAAITTLVLTLGAPVKWSARPPLIDSLVPSFVLELAPGLGG
jgi:hypothetical protein